MRTCPLKSILYSVGMTLFAEASLAQYIEQAPHWRVRTDPVTLTTTVHFFDAEQRLLYQESLPGKYFRLTDKNARKLNKILTQRLSRELIARKVNLLKLTQANIPTPKPKAFVLPTVNAPAGAWTCQAWIGEDHYLYLVVRVNNPMQKPLTLTVKNEKGTSIYIRRITHSAYQRSFKISHFSKGTYQFLITDREGGGYSRQLLVDWLPKTVLLPISSPQREQPAGEELVKIKRRTIPVSVNPFLRVCSPSWSCFGPLPPENKFLSRSAR